MNRVNNDNRPAAIEAVGDGSYLYRWQIEEVITEIDEQQEPRTAWECYEVRVWSPLSQDSITEAVIDALWGDGLEQKLINDYAGAQLGVLDESYAAPYLTFLAERKAVKAQITDDFAAWKSAM